MYRLLYITILLILPLQSIASVSYTVRIAVYKNVDSLQKELNKLSPVLRKTIEIQIRGEDHVVCSMQTKDKKTLQKLLPSYKKVFPDAFISVYQETNQSQIKVSKALSVAIPETDKVTPSRKLINPESKDITFYDRFKQKTLYLCAYGEDVGFPNVLMHVAFLEKEVLYTPIQGDVPVKRAEYKVENDKLYIFQKGIFDPEIYSTLDSITSEYYLISTWVGKRKVNTIRYYFDLEKAEDYLKTLK